MGLLRTKSTPAQTLRELEEKRIQLAGELERGEADVEAAERALELLAAREAAVFIGEEDPTLASDRDAARQALERAQAGLARLRLIGPEIDRRISVAEKAAAASRLDEARTALVKGLERRNLAAKALVDALPVKEHVALMKARASADELRNVHLAAGGDRFEETEGDDEPAFPDAAAAIAETLAAGPLQPTADGSARALRAKAERERGESRTVADALRKCPGSSSEAREEFLERYPVHLRDRIRDEHDVLLAADDEYRAGEDERLIAAGRKPFERLR